MDNKGVIYILTNPSFPEYVKIGYADDIKARVAQLNRSECTPFAFRIFATLNVPNRLADKNIHALIDKFKPELRAKDNVNGKIRVREFFAISPEEAFYLLNIIGGIYGETPVRLDQTKAAKTEEADAITVHLNSERRSPFSFYKCGIKNGEYIFYINDKNIKCKVVSDRCVEYNGKQTSVSALAKKLLNLKHQIQGTLYFTYNDEILSARRKRLEDEGNYKLPPTDIKRDKANVNAHTESSSRAPFSFSACGIKTGEQVVFKNNPSIICAVVSDRLIELNGETLSLTAAAKKIMNANYSLAGTLFFTYKHEVLADMRIRLEAEGKYGENKYDE